MSQHLIQIANRLAIIAIVANLTLEQYDKRHNKTIAIGYLHQIVRYIAENIGTTQKVTTHLQRK